MIVKLDASEIKRAEAIAAAKDAFYAKRRWTRPWSADRNLTGAKGEIAWSIVLGVEPVSDAENDDGVDFVLRSGRRAQAKTRKGATEKVGKGKGEIPARLLVLRRDARAARASGRIQLLLHARLVAPETVDLVGSIEVSRFCSVAEESASRFNDDDGKPATNLVAVDEQLDRDVIALGRPVEATEISIPGIATSLLVAPNPAAIVDLMAAGVGRGRIWTRRELARIRERGVPADDVPWIAEIKLDFDGTIEP